MRKITDRRDATAEKDSAIVDLYMRASMSRATQISSIGPVKREIVVQRRQRMELSSISQQIRNAAAPFAFSGRNQ